MPSGACVVRWEQRLWAERQSSLLGAEGLLYGGLSLRVFIAYVSA